MSSYRNRNCDCCCCDPCCCPIPGPQGPPGPPGTASDIQFSFTECPDNPETNISIDPASGNFFGPTTILILPPITVAEQIVKLESMAVVRLSSLTSQPTNFFYRITYSLLRNGLTIASTEEADTTTFIPTDIPRAHETCNITWIDAPLPGVYTYSVQISVETSNPPPNLNQREVGTRALTATLFPPTNVLPSTICTP